VFAILAASDPVSNEVIQSSLMTRKEEEMRERGRERGEEGRRGIRLLDSLSSCQIIWHR
jgi:predicted transposase YdaD